MLHVLGRVLSKQGYAVEVARTGKEAIEKIATKQFDLAIIDINLPDITGIELHKLISARSPATKKIILTGLPPEKSEIENVSDGPLNILIKPIPAQDLIAEIERTVSQK